MYKQWMRVLVVVTCFWVGGVGVAFAADAALPKTIAYSAVPSAYFDEHAAEAAALYDGFFFCVGDWDAAVKTNLGLGAEAPASTDWMAKVGKNLEHLRAAGATENLLGVCFAENGTWPSSETILSEDYAATLAKHFGRVGEVARTLGFRGVSIDVEYPYPRYNLDHEIYKYNGYTAEDLTAASKREGRGVMTALLNAFPDAVVFVLPGSMAGRPIEHAFTTGMLEVMVERDAPGGLHYGFERAYALLDPVAQVALPRAADLTARTLLSGKVLDYWKRRCTVAPGVWPLHMVETGGANYPVRAWRDELADLREQMRILRTVSKRYVWSYSGHPMWYPNSEDLTKKYDLPKQDFNGASEAVAGWQDILREKKCTQDTRLLKLVAEVRKFDRGRLTPLEFCDRFGTPGDWMILGPLNNPYTQPAFSAPSLSLGPVRPNEPVDGRDGLVRWFTFHSYDALGHVDLPQAFGWRRTDDGSAILATNVKSRRDINGFLWVGWDDGVVVRLNGKTVFSHPEYPARGHGMVFRDKYDFEEHVPIAIPKGESLLTVTSINFKGRWGVNLRLADEKGFPLDGISFSLPQGGEASKVR